MRRTTARELVGGVERFPVEARVSGLSEEWAEKALEALRVAVTRRNGSSGGESVAQVSGHGSRAVVSGWKCERWAP
jgi:hypothetical protein